MKNKPRILGLTLIEMIVAACILSFLGLVIYTALSQGLNAWHRTSQKRPELDLELFFEKLTLDLRNATALGDKALTGSGNALEFYALDVQNGSRPVRVSYQFNRERGTIKRTEDNYEEVLLPSQQVPREQMLAQGIKESKVQYYYYDEQHQVYGWAGDWKESCMPLALKIQVDFDDQMKTRKWMRYVPISSEICAGLPNGQ